MKQPLLEGLPLEGLPLEGLPLKVVNGDLGTFRFQQAALRALRDNGLPTKKTEAWRFSPARTLTHLVVETAPTSLTVEHGEGVASIEIDACPEFGQIAPTTGFAALNAVRYDHPTLLRTTRNAKVDSALIIHHHGGPGARYPRVFVEVAENSELLLIERFDGQSELTNAVTEILLRPGAILRHIRVHEDTGSCLGECSVRQERSSRYESHVISLSGKLCRLALNVDLVGSGAECELRGAYYGQGRDHLDHHLRVDHRAPHGTSRQLYHGLIEDKSTCVFDSQAIVHRTGPGAEAHQENRNLLLSKTANVFTKPHLEIDHDDVIASHGATVGQLQSDEIFYLRSRGVSDEDARSILTFAFLHALIDSLPAPALRAEISEKIQARLPAGCIIAETLDFDEN